MLVKLLSLLSLIFSVAVSGNGGNSVNAPVSSPSTTANKTTSSFMIGGLFSVTTDGVNAGSKGIHRLEAMKCAIDILNNENFIPGVTLHYAAQDDLGAVSTGLYKALGLVQDGIMAIVGAAGSSVTEPIARLVATFETPLISYASTVASLSDITKYPSLARTVASDVAQTKAMIAFARKVGWTLIAAAGTSDNYGSAGLAGFVSNAAAAEIVVPCNHVFQSTTAQSEIDAFSACLATSKAKAVMLFMNEIDAATVISKLNATGVLSTEMAFIASDSWAVSEVITYGLANFASTFSKALIKGSVGVIPNPGDMSWFMPCYGARTPANNNYTLFINFWETKFKCKTTGAYSTCPPTISARTTACLCDGSESLNTETPNSKVSFVYDSVYAIANAVKTIITNCTALTFKDMCTPTSFTNSDVIHAIRELSFSGKTGTVAFNGVDPVYASFLYLQFDGTTWNTIGSYDSSANIADITAPYTWSNDVLPVSAIIPVTIGWQDGFSLFVTILCSILIALALVTMYFFHIHRDKPIIKRSSPIFCNLMLLGLIMVWTSLYLWNGDQNAGTCSVKIWLAVIGFGIVMGNMLAKNYRIWRIFDNDKLRSRVITNRELLYFSAVIVSVEIILLGIFMKDPPIPTIVKSASTVLYQYQACRSIDPAFQSAMTYILIAYNAILVVAGSFLAFYTRKVVSSFNESKFIAVSMYNILICIAVLAPIYFTSGDADGVSMRLFIIRTLACLWASVMTYVALFVPKIRQLITNSSKEEHNANRVNTNSDGPSGGNTGGGGNHTYLNTGGNRRAKVKNNSTDNNNTSVTTKVKGDATLNDPSVKKTNEME